jgi:hypothetical protein
MYKIIIFGLKSLFICIDFGYPRSYHDVNILQLSNIYREWWEYFSHDDETFLLGDLEYMGEEMFTMWRIGRTNVNMDAMHAYIFTPLQMWNPTLITM